MLRKYFVLSSDFTKNTITLVLGTAVAQSIPFLLHPFLRRIYSTEDFGAISIYLSLLGIISIASSLRYEAAVVLPKKDDDAANIFVLTFLINLGFTFLIYLALFLFKDKIVSFMNFPVHYANYLFLLPLVSFIFSVYQSMNYWLIRQKAFKASTKNKIVRRGVEGGVQVGLGLMNFPGGLFLGDLAGNLANMFAGYRQMLKNLFHPSNISLRHIRNMAAEYKQFPMFNLLPTLLSSLANAIPFLLINKYYSTEAVGFLDLTKLVLSIPLIFISATIAQVLFQQITVKKNNSESIGHDIRKILILLMAIILFEMVIIFPFGKELFGFVFGSKYELSGYYSQLLIFSFASNFLSSTFSCVFITLNRLKLNAIWQILYFFSICSLILFKDLNIVDFLKVFVTIDVSMQVLYCILIYFIVVQYEKKRISDHVQR